MRVGIPVVVVAMLAACAAPPPPPSSKTLVVLVPGAGGRVGAVSVKSAQGEALIDQAYTSATAAGGAAPVIGSSSPSQVQQVFGAAMSARPQPPVSYTLNFLEGRDEYTPESRAAFEAILAELGKRPTADIAVIGHTDRVGALEYNDRLSLQRTERVRADLIKRGVPERSISVAGRGEREPLVATADEVPEPRNRRVEINIR
jgi:outer membrane protein OmpA-like peptidoglycan-associated protein